ncbi:MAG: HAD family hydrolase [Clostridia bacterium]|nr:HAD family hydrolase [Clostridia bacterium]
MKKLVIFDLDGTLLNTIEDIRRMLNMVITKYGYKALNSQETLKCVGYGARALVEKATQISDQEKVDKMFNELVPIMRDCDNSLTFLYDGLDGALKSLKSLGYKLAIVSNKPDVATQVIVGQKLKDYGFDFVTGNKPGVFTPKPDKSCVEYCLNTLGVAKEDAVFVGDSEVDVKTFINASIEGIGVTWGFRPKNLLVEAGCKHFANTAEELVEIIKSL